MVGRLSKKWVEILEDEELKNSIIQNTSSYLGNNFIERLYWVRNDIYEHPKCEVCGKPIQKTFESFIKGYRKDDVKYCSPVCVGIGTKEKISRAKSQERKDLLEVNEENILEVIKNSCYDSKGRLSYDLCRKIPENVLDKCVKHAAVQLTSKMDKIKWLVRRIF